MHKWNDNRISIDRLIGKAISTANRMGNRLLFAATTSALHLLVIVSVERAEDAGGLSFALAPIYLVFLFLDSAFQTTNDIRRQENLQFNVLTQALIFLPTLPLYWALASWEDVARNPFLLLGLFAAITLVRSFHSSMGLLYVYSKATSKVLVMQGIVLVLQLLFMLLGYFELVSGEVQVICQMLSFGAPFLLMRPPLPWSARGSKDSLILIFVLLDFTRNQIVFIVFSAAIASAALADIMLVRSVLGPAVLLIASRRKALEDAVINDRIEKPNFLRSSFPIYVLIMLLPLPMALLGFHWEISLVWCVTLLIQDYRAHLVRMGLALNELPASFPALTSGMSLVIVLALLTLTNGFSIAFICLPAIVDLLVLLAFTRLANWTGR